MVKGLQLEVMKMQQQQADRWTPDFRDNPARPAQPICWGCGNVNTYDGNVTRWEEAFKYLSLMVDSANLGPWINHIPGKLEKHLRERQKGRFIVDGRRIEVEEPRAHLNLLSC